MVSARHTKYRLLYEQAATGLLDWGWGRLRTAAEIIAWRCMLVSSEDFEGTFAR